MYGTQGEEGSLVLVYCGYHTVQKEGRIAWYSGVKLFRSRRSHPAHAEHEIEK